MTSKNARFPYEAQRQKFTVASLNNHFFSELCFFFSSLKIKICIHGNIP